MLSGVDEQFEEVRRHVCLALNNGLISDIAASRFRVDAIYADTKLIAHLEANPDIDEAFKGPIILAARADVHRLRKILGPGEPISAAPCCYFRKRLYVR